MRNIPATELLQAWRRLVNTNTRGPADMAMLNSFMEKHGISAVQVYLGFWAYLDNKTITIPRFLSEYEEWVHTDEWEAEMELARRFDPEGIPTEAYFTYYDLKYEFPTPDALGAFQEARSRLDAWKDEVLA